MDSELHGLSFYGLLEDIATATGKSVDLIELSEIRAGANILDDLEQGVVFV